ncbi:hypothetical protein [Corallococcus sp. Z5C101001]|uniref:hypothetical protein n=1 Tax=Corallococcus sp. Z5C101001 TaxID=2596829 RepID=UPI0011809512|nr:hypothetical protein [Corallococcus sp. Z5C101001]TSC23607.1 hypothetical protein FOF48_29060 [Corallococcus sp. Z5C101001]
MSPLMRRVLHPLVLLAFFALSVFHTWPLLSHLKGFVLGGREDVYMNMWHLWWMRQALWVQPQNPFFAPLLHWPLGAELYWHTLAPAKTLWGVVLLPWMPVETAYNVVLFGSFVLTGYTSWLLLRYLLERAGHGPWLSAAAALAGACVFNFSRYHLDHAIAHLNLSALEGLPLYLLCFFRWLDEGKRKWLVGLALCALYVLLCDYYYLVYIALFSLLWVVAERWKRGPLFSVDMWKDPVVRRAVVAGVAAGLACVPPMVPLLLHAFPAPLQIHHGDSDYFTDLYAFFIPDTRSAWMTEVPEKARAFAQDLLRAKMSGNAEESGTFVGWVTPLLAVFALWRGVPDGRRWLGLGLGFAVLSMGTVLNIGMEDRVSPVVLLIALFVAVALMPAWRERVWRRDVLLLMAVSIWLALSEPLTAFNVPLKVQIPMPYVVFKQVVPLFSRGGMPMRFVLLTFLALAVLVAFAAAHAGAWASRRDARLGMAVALAVALVPNVEYRGLLMPVPPVPRLPQVFDEIRDAPMPAAVLTDNVQGQWEQIYHGKPVSFARLSRLPVRESAMVDSRLIRAAEGMRNAFGTVSPQEREEMRRYLKEHHFKWYVTHLFHPIRHRFIEDELGGVLVHQDGYVTVYRFP